MRHQVIRGVFVMSLIGAAAVALAAPRGGGWTLLGKKTVSDRAERDTITVGVDRGHFDAVKIKVSRRAVEFRSVEVVFGDGSVQDVGLRRVIPAGGESRVIDLEGKDRRIRRIELHYDAQSRGGPAKVKVVGRR